MKTLLAEWQAKVDALTDRLTEAHTLNNELVSRCDRAESQVSELRIEMDKFQRLEKSYKDKISEVKTCDFVLCSGARVELYSCS